MSDWQAENEFRKRLRAAVTDAEKRTLLLDELVKLNGNKEALRRIFAGERLGVLEAFVASAREISKDPVAARTDDIRFTEIPHPNKSPD